MTIADRVNVQRVPSSAHIAHAVMRHGDQVMHQTIGPRLEWAIGFNHITSYHDQQFSGGTGYKVGGGTSA